MCLLDPASDEPQLGEIETRLRDGESCWTTGGRGASWTGQPWAAVREREERSWRDCRRWGTVELNGYTGKQVLSLIDRLLALGVQSKGVGREEKLSDRRLAMTGRPSGESCRSERGRGTVEEEGVERMGRRLSPSLMYERESMLE